MAKSVDASDEWDYLLQSGIGADAVAYRRSSYLQTNFILAGLLATIVFGNLASARLFDLTDGTTTCPCFDLTDGTTTCPVSALDITAPCTKTLPQYEKSVMALSAQFFFYATGYLCLPMMLSIISMCTVADFSLKFITDEKDVNLFLTIFRRVLHVDVFGLIIVFEFLGMHFGSLMLFHMNFSASAWLLVGFSLTFLVVFIYMIEMKKQFKNALFKRRTDASLSP